MTYRSPQPLRLSVERCGDDDEVGRGEHDPEQHCQQRAHGQQDIGHEGDQHELPHALLGPRGAQGPLTYPGERGRERATQQREGEAEEQRELGDLLQLRHVQVLDVSDNEKRKEDHAVHGARALGQSEARAGQKLHKRQRGRGNDEHSERLERGGLLELQVVVLEQCLELMAVELVLACASRAVTLSPMALNSVARLHVRAMHKAGGARTQHNFSARVPLEPAPSPGARVLDVNGLTALERRERVATGRGWCLPLFKGLCSEKRDHPPSRAHHSH